MCQVTDVYVGHDSHKREGHDSHKRELAAARQSSREIKREYLYECVCVCVCERERERERERVCVSECVCATPVASV